MDIYVANSDFKNIIWYCLYVESKKIKNKGTNESMYRTEIDLQIIKQSYCYHGVLENHNSVVIHLDPAILECEGKWTLGSIVMNKASGGDGIPTRLFQIRWCC